MADCLEEVKKNIKILGFKSRHSCILCIWNREESLSTDHRESFEENWNCLSTDRASNWNFESTEF